MLSEATPPAARRPDPGAHLSALLCLPTLLSVGVVTVICMTTEPLTEEELRNQVAGVLRRYGMTVDEFVAADIDDLPSDELRDVWLMVKGALTSA